MREITTHTVAGAAGDTLTVTAIDEPGAGGAHHAYDINGFPSDPLKIRFQNGPIGTAGVNGVTQEALAAVIIDRLECFQAGPFASDHNESALKHFKKGLRALQQRTIERLARGVEGQNVK